MAEFDLIVRAGLVYPGPGAEPIPEAGLAVKDGLIAAISPWEDLSGRGPAIGGPDRLALPGLVNAHTHLPMVLFRGLADDLPLMDWLQNHIWPAEAKLGREEIYWGAKLALAEAIRSGTTTLADGYFHEIEVVRAVAETGLRAVLAQGVIDFPTMDNLDPSRTVARAAEFLDRAEGVSDLIRPAVFCHSPYTCSAETLAQAKNLADKHGTLAFIHLSETASEVETVLKISGRRPAFFLEETGFLDQNTVAVHGVHLDEGEITLLAERRVGLVTCPESNLKLASGLARVETWPRAGLRFGLGTDGAASNNDLNLFGEMGTLARWHKGVSGDPTTLPAETVLRAATEAGAEILGFSGLGRLEPGRPADLITLDLTEPNLNPLHHVPAQLVYAAGGGEVRESVVAGRVLMENGDLKTIDLDRVTFEILRLAKNWS